MALIKCPECGKEISDTAKNCIHCGYALAKSNSSKKSVKKWILIFVPVVLIGALLVTLNFVKSKEYSKAVTLVEEENYMEAYAVFDKLGNYKDSEEQKENIIKIQNEIKEEETTTEQTETTTAESTSQTTVSTTEEQQTTEKTTKSSTTKKADVVTKVIQTVKQTTKKVSTTIAKAFKAKTIRQNTIAASGCHTFAIKNDGTVIKTNYTPRDNDDIHYCEYYCDLAGVKDVVAVSTYGSDNMVFLKNDGTVIAFGKNEDGQCNVADWKNIVAVDTGGHTTVGLKKDGTVVAVGSNVDACNKVKEWKDIVNVRAGIGVIFGIRKDGTVAVAEAEWKTEPIKTVVEEWTDIVSIETTSMGGVVGVKKDGTIVLTGDDFYNMAEWTDIVDITDVRSNIFIGLKSDGTVVCSSDTQNKTIGTNDMSMWKNIIAISGGFHSITGLKADGTVVVDVLEYEYECGQSQVQNFNNIKMPQ